MTIDTDLIDAIRDNATARFDKIRNSQTATPEAKRSSMARVLLNAKAAIAKIHSDDDNAVNGRENALAKRLYGIPNPSDSSASISYRDAQDRAAKIDDESEAVTLYLRSQNSGDDLLARALLEWGYANLWIDVVNAYVEKNPSNEPAAQELWDITATRATTINNPALNNVFEAFAYLPPVPPELIGINDYRLAELADGPTIDGEL